MAEFKKVAVEFGQVGVYDNYNAVVDIGVSAVDPYQCPLVEVAGGTTPFETAGKNLPECQRVLVEARGQIEQCPYNGEVVHITGMEFYCCCTHPE